MVIFYKKWKKYNEIQLTKSKLDLNIRKMTNHPPSPQIETLKETLYIKTLTIRKKFSSVGFFFCIAYTGQL